MLRHHKTRNRFRSDWVENLETRTLLSATPVPTETAPASVSSSDLASDVSHRLVAIFQNNQPSNQTFQFLQALGGRETYRYDTGGSAWELPDEAARNAAVDWLEGQSDVLSVEPDVVLSSAGFPDDAAPNDTLYPAQYDLNQSNNVDLNLPDAWQITLGRSSTKVAVLDSGVDYKHPDLYLNIWLNPGEIPTSKASMTDTNGDGQLDFWDLNSLDNNRDVVTNAGGTPVNAGFASDRNGNGFIDGGDLLNDSTWADGINQDNNSFTANGTSVALTDDLIGWDFRNGGAPDGSSVISGVNWDNNPMDTNNSHGTLIAGIIAATGNNGVGSIGIAPNVRIMIVKAGNGTTFSSTEIVNPTNYAANKGARVMNASIAFANVPSTSQNPSAALTAWKNAIIAAANTGGAPGMAFVAAAGNDGYDTSLTTTSGNARFPANFSSRSPSNNVISVASIDRWGARANNTNFGSLIDIAAPGVNINGPGINNTYVTLKGTSFAAPHVAGVLALMDAVQPTAGPSQLIDWLIQGAKTITLDPTRPASTPENSLPPSQILAPVTRSNKMVDAFGALSVSLGGSVASGQLTAEAVGPGEVKLTFDLTNVSTPGGYELAVTKDDGLTYLPLSVTGQQNHFLVVGLDPGTLYGFRLTLPFSQEFAFAQTQTRMTPKLSSLETVSFTSSADTSSQTDVVGGSWTTQRGIVSQASGMGQGFSKKMVIKHDQPSLTDQEIFARVRIDNFSDGLGALRAGVTVGADASGAGYGLVFRQLPDGRKVVQLFDDATNTYGQSQTFNWSENTWYFFRLQMTRTGLRGKVWADGDAEPAAFQVQQTNWPYRAGLPALDGGSVNTQLLNGTANGRGTTTPPDSGLFVAANVSFDDVVTRDPVDPTVTDIRFLYGRVGSVSLSRAQGSALRLLPVQDVNAVQIAFSSDVLVDARDFRIQGTKIAEYPFNFSYDAVRQVATLRLTGRILDGDVITLRIDGDDASADGNVGVIKRQGGLLTNFLALGDQSHQVGLLAGDLDGNGVIDAADYNLITRLVGRRGGVPANIVGDLNGDGLIDSKDLSVVMNASRRLR